MEHQRQTYYIDTGGRAYISYDRTHGTARLIGDIGGAEVQISEEALIDFIHTAQLLGFKAGKMRAR